MTITEYINKLHEWAKDIGPEDEVQVSPSRLLMAYDSNYWKELVANFDKNKELIKIFYRCDNN